MKRIPNIKFNSQKIYQLLQQASINYGGEAIICRTNNPHTIYKIFMSDNKPQPLSSNKESKINRLFELQLENSTHPLSTISMDGILIGYEMTYDENDRPITILEPSRIETIDALERSQEVLEYFKTQDIIYGDVKNDNILINRKTGKITFCDMDNIQIGEYQIDVASQELSNFLSFGRKEFLDSYMHNLLTLEMLNYFYIERYDEIFSILKREKLPEGYEKEAIPIIHSMLKPQEFNGEYLIQHVKRKI